MKSKVNFHIHTVHSDGGRTVEQVVDELKEEGVTYFAITDHDTVDGVDEAMRLAEKNGLHCVAGVEISGVFGDDESSDAYVEGLDSTCVAHIVALDFDIQKMRDLLYGYKLDKEEKVISLTYVLMRKGYPISKEKILHGDLSGRTAVAKELVRAGCATSVNDAFKRILNSNDFVEYAATYPYANDVVRDIKGCGGLAVLAHPFGYTRGGKKEMSHEQVEAYIKKFKNADAMEVFYQHYDGDRIAYLGQLADKYGLMKSIGTDYHMSSLNLQQPTKSTAKLKVQTLSFDVDGVTADESILSVIKGRK